MKSGPQRDLDFNGDEIDSADTHIAPTIIQRKIDEYNKFVSRTTELFSNEDANSLLLQVLDCAEKQGLKITVSDKKYKMKFV